MDTSPEYINMCQKARELQEMWKPQLWDMVHIPGMDQLYGYPETPNYTYALAYGTDSGFEGPELDEAEHSKESFVWLPRIDQYLDLLGIDYPTHEGFTMTIKDRSKVEQELLADYYKKTTAKYGMARNGY